MIINVLKNGEVVKDLTGHIVKREEAPEVYAILERVKKGEKNDGQV